MAYPANVAVAILATLAVAVGRACATAGAYALIERHGAQKIHLGLNMLLSPLPDRVAKRAATAAARPWPVVRRPTLNRC